MSEQKLFTRKVIAERGTKKDAVFIIDNVVYDVTKFLDDHPGGHEVLVNAAGKDTTEDFTDVGHSTDAKEMMKKYVIGELVDEDKVCTNKKEFHLYDSSADSNSGGFLTSWKFPVVLGLLMTVLYSYLFG